MEGVQAIVQTVQFVGIGGLLSSIVIDIVSSVLVRAGSCVEGAKVAEARETSCARGSVRGRGVGVVGDRRGYGGEEHPFFGGIECVLGPGLLQGQRCCGGDIDFVAGGGVRELAGGRWPLVLLLEGHGGGGGDDKDK
jgi:hypothetical protein